MSNEKEGHKIVLESHRAPDWSTKALAELLNRLETNEEVLHLCIRGITMITRMPQALSVLAEGTTKIARGVSDKEIAHAEMLSKLAQREISSDFSILHSQSVVFLWNALESTVKDVLRDWVVNRPEIMTAEPWSNQKVRIGEYEPLDVEQRAAFIVDLVDQNTGGPLKQGAGRFESLLETVKLNGGIEENLRKNLYELQQVRNVLVHRAGIADRRLCECCPWLNLKLGTPLTIGHEQFERYTQAVGTYLLELIFRNGETFGDSDIRERSRRAANQKSGVC